jgi:hypothetical protein
MKSIDKDVIMKKKMLITLISAVIVIMAVIATILFLVFKSDRIIQYKITTVFHFREIVPENTIAGILIADCAKPKYFEKAAILAVGFQKPLFCYFGSAPTHEGTPIPVDMSKRERDRIIFSYLIQGENDSTYDKSITFVCKQKKEGYYIGYVIPICIQNGKVYGEMFNSSELYDILTNLFKKHDAPMFQNNIKTQ